VKPNKYRLSQIAMVRTQRKVYAMLDHLESSSRTEEWAELLKRWRLVTGGLKACILFCNSRSTKKQAIYRVGCTICGHPGPASETIAGAAQAALREEFVEAHGLAGICKLHP